jgi:hypothetical protein
MPSVPTATVTDSGTHIYVPSILKKPNEHLAQFLHDYPVLKAKL